MRESGKQDDDKACAIVEFGAFLFYLQTSVT
jgi:hypothetical protein